MTYQPREGDRVRVVLEGVVIPLVDHRGTGPGFFLGEYDTPGLVRIHMSDTALKSIEKLPEPESWQPGDVVLDEDRKMFWRSWDNAAWVLSLRIPGVGNWDETPTGKLILIARDGKPVNS